MKHEYALDFAPPFVGLDNELYNTFRLGTSWSKRLAKGDEVYIQSSKDKLIFSKACVEDVIVGQIGELMLLHAHNNHNELGKTTDAAQSVYTRPCKRCMDRKSSTHHVKKRLLFI